MKLRYRLFRRSSGIYFVEDRATGEQESLKTRDITAAHGIFNARNEAHQQPAINLQIARAYHCAFLSDISAQAQPSNRRFQLKHDCQRKKNHGNRRAGGGIIS